MKKIQLPQRMLMSRHGPVGGDEEDLCKLADQLPDAPEYASFKRIAEIIRNDDSQHAEMGGEHPILSQLDGLIPVLKSIVGRVK